MLALSVVALATTVAALVLWAVGVMVSDRFGWTQRLSFVPRQFLVWPSGMACAAFAGLSSLYGALRPRSEGVPWRSERRGRSRLPRFLGRARGVLGVAVLAATVHLVCIEWRWPVNASRAAPGPGDRLRVIHWNVGWSHPDEVFDALASRGPDVAIVVNPLTRTDLSWDFAGLGARLGGEGRVIRDWPINVVSRWPIRRWGVTELGFTSPVAVEAGLGDGTRPPLDPGHAMFVELEVGAPLDRTVVVWIIDLPSDPISIHGLEARLAQVFVNLVTNAISFCDDGDAVRVWARRRENRVLIVVEDTGPGIPEQALTKVFKRFYSERPQAEFGKHSGLGLAISKQIVEAHGGVIWAENIRPTAADPTSEPLGARFVVGLPV